LVEKLKNDGFWVRGVDLKKPEFSNTNADNFVVGDLRDPYLIKKTMQVPPQLKEINENFDEIYQLAADMGGTGYFFGGNHYADIIHNSALINLNVNNIAFFPEVYLSHNKLPQLVKLVSTLDIGLGIFGASEKALQVIPNKIFEGIDMKLPLITSNTLAIKELFTNDKDIVLCERVDPISLVKIILRLKMMKN